jgi:hypothetical protein
MIIDNVLFLKWIVKKSYELLVSYAIAASSLQPPNAKPGYIDQIFVLTP